MNDIVSNSAVPARAGFYRVTTASGRELIAEYRSVQGSRSEKTWFEHVSSDPTVEKSPQRIPEPVTAFAKAAQDDIDAALRRELTLAEQCEKAYDSWCRECRVWDGYFQVDLPERRRVKVGEQVRVGALEDCVVVAVYQNAQVVAVQATHRDNAQIMRTVTAWPWTLVDRLESVPKPPVFSKPRTRGLSFSSSDVESLLSQLMKWNFDDSPQYQRGYAWSLQDKERLIESALARRELGKVVIVRRPHPLRPHLLDGKQRISTLLDFKAGKFAYKGYFWDQLSCQDQVAINEASMLVAQIDEEHVTRAFVLQTFLDLNAAGVPQTDEHIALVQEQLVAELAKESGSATSA
jgi:hypothetical protein